MTCHMGSPPPFIPAHMLVALTLVVDGVPRVSGKLCLSDTVWA